MSTVLITGANRGVGLELVKLYAQRGDTVLACCRNPEAAEALAAVDGDVEVIGVHVTDGDSVAAMAAELEGRAIDIVINNAGAVGPSYDKQTARVMDFDGWLENFEINTLAPVRVMQALLDNLKAGDDAKVVSITSQMGALSLDMPVAYSYCTSKAALNKFMKLAALDLGKDGINVCVIHPGFVQTDMGGPNAEISAQESAEGIVAVIDGLNAENNGSFWKWNGEVHGW